MPDYLFKVSVVVPSYNRAHLLPRTLPTYLQEDVGELILVDDCSVDSTQQVVADLQKCYPNIRYLRNEVNSKQAYTKNRGIAEARGEYVYFGDDDSVLVPGSIRSLLNAIRETGADIAGARALYMGSYCSENDADISVFERWRRDKDVVPAEKIASVVPFESHFNAWCGRRADTPYLHACLLCKQAGAKHILFDPNYTGCAYREETDFCVRAVFAGMRLVYEPCAVQINLPRHLVRATGAHADGRKQWLSSALECNRYFFDKNWEMLVPHFSIHISKEEMLLQTESDIRRIADQRQNALKDVLKKIYFRCVVFPRYRRSYKK